MRVLMVVNSGKEQGVRDSKTLTAMLSGRGIDVLTIESEKIARSNGFSQEASACVEWGADLICTFGGDGTLLSAAQIAFRGSAPMLGFNYGTLGFLTGASSESMVEAVEAALRGELPGEKRAALDVRVDGTAAGSSRSCTVLNEVAMTRGVSGRLVDYTVMIDGDKLADMRADGVIVASATGSTAYSLSAGGPLLAPTLQGMVISALAPHTLISRAMVTDGNQEVRIIPDTRGDAECCVFADGKRICMEGGPVALTVTMRKDAVTLLRYDMPSFTRRASGAFFGEQP